MKSLFTKFVFLLSLSLIGLIFLGQNSKVEAASLLVNPPFGDVKAGEDLKIDVVLKGQDELIDGVDANIAYDTNFLKVKEMKKGDFFGEYPTFKDDSGQVKITALAPSDGVKIFGDIVVANLVFEVLDSGNTTVKVAYEEGATSESNVPMHGSASDLLTEVNEGNYKVEASAEKLQEARLKKARQSGLIPVLIFIVLIIIVGFGIWYYRRKKKPQEDYFVPEEFPMDEVPKSDTSSNESSPQQ